MNNSLCFSLQSGIERPASYTYMYCKYCTTGARFSTPAVIMTLKQSSVSQVLSLPWIMIQCPGCQDTSGAEFSAPGVRIPLEQGLVPPVLSFLRHRGQCPGCQDTSRAGFRATSVIVPLAQSSVPARVLSYQGTQLGAPGVVIITPLKEFHVLGVRYVWNRVQCHGTVPMKQSSAPRGFYPDCETRVQCSGSYHTSEKDFSAPSTIIPLVPCTIPKASSYI